MKKPVKKDGKIEAINYNSVILEEVRDNVKGVAETVSILSGTIDRVDKRLEKVESGIKELRNDNVFLKGEVALIRHSQITRDEFKLLETRVLQLERRAVR